jgi:DNA-binding NarL/FixJ family response regulator
LRYGASAPGIEILAEGTLTAVAELAASLKPDIVVLDVQTAAPEALRAIQQIHARAPGTRILACSQPAGTEFGLLCLTTGAWGYVSKEIDLALLPRILHALASGEAVIPRAMSTGLVRRYVGPDAADRPRTDPLSAPECRLLELLRTGLNLQEAAAELGVTVSTVRRHFGSARRKLSVPQR